MFSGTLKIPDIGGPNKNKVNPVKDSIVGPTRFTLVPLLYVSQHQSETIYWTKSKTFDSSNLLLVNIYAFKTQV